MKSGNFGILISIVLLVWGCRKDNWDEDLGSICQDSYFSFSSPGADTSYVNVYESGPVSGYTSSGQYRFGKIISNPNNPFEILVIRVSTDNYNPDNELVIFNFCTGESKIITTNVVSPIQWTKTNWIVFRQHDQQSFKVKPNGDSLTAIQFNETYAAIADWSPSGKQYCYFANGQYHIKKYNDQNIGTTKLDGFNTLKWYSEDQLAGVKQKHLYLYTIKSKTTGILNSTPFNGYDFVLDENRKFCYTINEHQLLRYNIQDRISCDTLLTLPYNNSFRSIDCLKKQNKLIITMDRLEWQDSVQKIITETSFIILADTKTFDLRTVKLPG